MARYDIAGKVALVTGASRGIGEALAIELAARGAKLAVLARTEADLDSVCARITDAGGHAAPFALDLRDAARAGADGNAIQALVGRITDTLGPVDILINNAGAGLYSEVVDVDEEALRRVFELNVVAPHALVRAVVPEMEARGGGVIVNVSSVIGRRAVPMAGGYCASKYALEALTECLRAELSHRGIHVMVARPGKTESQFSEAAESPSGWRPPAMTAMPAEVVARGIADAIARRKSRVDFTVAGRALMTMQRVSPGITDRAMKYLYRRLHSDG